ncbi:Metallo-dependent hydrolase [Aureobasidium subglaciale]|nr:Metallo-dependent hydrolase [Aureobasidium subglaciale]
MSRPLRTGQILVGLASLPATALCANSTLFHEGTIITFDEASQPPVTLHGSSLLVTGDSIAKIFESSDDVTLSAGTVIIDVAGKIVSPGFIDTHRHSWQTAYKTLGPNTTLAEYFGRYGEFTQAGTVLNLRISTTALLPACTNLWMPESLLSSSMLTARSRMTHPTHTSDQLGLPNGTTPIVFSHASYVTTDDAELLRKHDQYISTTPESEMHYGHARIWLQSTRLRFFYQSLDNWNIPRNSPMSAHKAFTLATRSGALALRRPNLGVLATGNKADIVVFDGDSSNLLGWSDPVAVVILHSHVGDIRHVMVGGEWRKRDRQLVTRQNRTEVQTKFLESAKRIQRTWLETPLPEMGGEFNWMSHVDYMDAYAVDAVRGNGTGY